MLALALGGVVSLVLFFVVLGVRADIEPALATWRFDLKIGMVLVALVLAFGLCLALSRPDPSGRPLRRLLPLAALAVMAVVDRTRGPPQRVMGNAAGRQQLADLPVGDPDCCRSRRSRRCSRCLRAAAPASPALAGAAAGLLAAASGATLYAFHCFDDSPLFVVTWYSLAAIPVILLGAIAGRRLLRW